MNEIDEFEL